MSYRTLVSKLFDAPEDRALAARWAARLHADGVRESQVEALLHEASRVSARPDGSQMTPEESVAYLADFARHIGATEAQVEGSSKWWNDGGPEPPAPAAPTRESDAATIAEAEALLAKDAQSYFRNKDLVARYGEALERRAAPPAPTSADLGEIAPVDHWGILRERARADTRRFEDMLADPEGSRKYWASAELRAQYSQAIQRAQDIETAANAPPPPPTTLAGGADVVVPVQPPAAAAAE